MRHVVFGTPGKLEAVSFGASYGDRTGPSLRPRPRRSDCNQSTFASCARVKPKKSKSVRERERVS